MNDSCFSLAAVLLLTTTSLGAQPFPQADVERGRYLAVAADCTACHTDPRNAVAFAGGYAIESPIGLIYATNITPSPQHGIGAYTERQFTDALREGVRPDGSHLYPAMPYTSYAGLADDDIHALYAYFMQGVKPVDTIVPATQLPFPFNLRFSMAFWNALFLVQDRFANDPTHDAQWNRGAYLVNHLEHCSACHTPRGVLMQEIVERRFSGASLGAWYAPNITNAPARGIGAWSTEDLKSYFRTGHVAGKAQAAGGMAEAVTNSLSLLTDSDLAAIAHYVKSIPGERESQRGRAAFLWGEPSSQEANLRGASNKSRGAGLYSGLCASCHGIDGSGSADHVIPSLFHNSTVGAERPDDLVAVILHGVDRSVGTHHVLMPDFGGASFVQTLADQDVADVANYVRVTFGPGGNLTASQVAVARQGGPRPPLLVAVLAAEAFFGLTVLIAMALLVRRLIAQRLGDRV